MTKERDAEERIEKLEVAMLEIYAMLDFARQEPTPKLAMEIRRLIEDAFGTPRPIKDIRL